MSLTDKNNLNQMKMPWKTVKALLEVNVGFFQESLNGSYLHSKDHASGHNQTFWDSIKISDSKKILINCSKEVKMCCKIDCICKKIPYSVGMQKFFWQMIFT